MDPRVVERLAAEPEVAAVPGLAEVGAAAFAYAAVLLEDDASLTAIGNPTSDAKARLRARVEELLGLARAGSDAP